MIRPLGPKSKVAVLLPSVPKTSAFLKKGVRSFCFVLIMALAVVVAFVSSSRPIEAQSLATTSRVVQGKVFADNGSPQQGAIVYLKDQKSLEIKTFISAQGGDFRFGQLGSQDDYTVWAEFGGHKSKTKNISSFDSKKVFDISLHLEAK